MGDRVTHAPELGGQAGAQNGGAAAEESDGALAARVRQLEQALRVAEQRHQRIFNNANDIVYILDMQGAFITVNETALRWTGYTIEEVCGRPNGMVVAPEYLELTRARG
ncbi:MAG TPA: PAS domain-containing protein [Tepidiformaceae bacterium]|nr:PAS domain-containing protein [Tepidiformaceae bacterium]